MNDRLLIIDATTKCNQKCIFCFERDIHFTKPDLSIDAIRRIILKAKRDGFTYVNFIGGEITLVAWLPEAITFIKKNGMKVGIVTNGTLFSNKEYAEKVISAGLDHIELSFHSHIAKDDQKITGIRNGLALRRKALENISTLKRKHKTVSLYINIVVNALNYAYLIDTVRSLGKYPFDHVDIKVLRITGNIKDTTIIPRYRAMKSHLSEVMSFLMEEKIPFKFENIPLCCIPVRYYLKSMELIHAVENVTTGGHGFYYGNSKTNDIDFAIFSGKNEGSGNCGSCVMKKFCCRPQKEYLALFGDAEFKPIRNIDEIKKYIVK